MQSVFFMSVLQPGSIRGGVLCVEIYKIGFFLVEKWAFCCVNAKKDERVVVIKWKIVSQLSSLHFMLQRSSKWTESWNSCSRAYCGSVVLCTLWSKFSRLDICLGFGLFFLLRSCEYGLGRNRSKHPGDRIYEQYVKVRELSMLLQGVNALLCECTWS